MKETKRVVTINNRSNSEMNHFNNNFLKNMEYDDSDARIIIKDFSIASNFRGVRRLIEFLIEEFELAFADRKQFQ